MLWCAARAAAFAGALPVRSWLNLWGDLRGLPRASWTLALVTLINRAGTMVHPFLALHFTQNLGFSAGEAALVVGAYGAASVVTAPLSGRLADRLGALPVMRASLLLSGVTLWLLPLARTRWTALAAVVALGMVSEAFRPANLALVGELGGSRMRKQAFALNRLAVNLGMSVGPAVGGLLAMVSFPLLFWVDGATSLLAGLLLLVAPLEGPPRAAPAFAPAASPRRLPLLAALLPDRRLGYFLVAMLAAQLVFFQHVGAYPLFLVRTLGLPEAFFGLTYTVNTALIVLFEVRLTGATAHWPLRRTLGVGAALCALGFGAHVVAHDAWAVLAAVVVWTAGEMILLPGAAAYVSEVAPAGRGGESMGLYTMCSGLALTVGPAAGITVMEHSGSGVLWGAALVLGLLSAGMLARVETPGAAEKGAGTGHPAGAA